VRVLLIVNPIAGQARPGSAVPRLRECLRGFASECVVHLTEDRGDARRAASRVAPDRFDAVVAVGGDGTINEVVNGLAVDVPLGIIPLGTANVLARELGIPVNDLPAACQLLRTVHPRPIDLGLANGRRFTLMAGIGFDGAVVQEVLQPVKERIGAPAYVLAALGTLARYGATGLTVETERERFETSAFMLVAANAATYAYGIEVAPFASLDDGWLDLCVFEQKNKAEFLRQSLAVLARRHEQHPDVRYVRARRVRVTADQPLAIQLDGDLHGRTPAEIELLPAALRVFRP
jgi:diacylglycerol kinase (ATP)